MISEREKKILRIIVDEYIKTAVLPSCVWSIEFKVSKGRLHGYVHQRSADVPLGLTILLRMTCFFLKKRWR